MLPSGRFLRSTGRRPFWTLLALAVVAALLAAAVAAGDVYDAGTALKLHATPARTRAGDRVVLRGQLSSARRGCRSHRRVHVVQVGSGRALGSVVTDGTGRFSLPFHPRRTESVYARFGGSFVSSYGSSERCRPSASKQVTIRVRRP